MHMCAYAEGERERILILPLIILRLDVDVLNIFHSDIFPKYQFHVNIGRKVP